MRSVEEMSTEELLRAIDYCDETGTNFSSHGQSDDYIVGSQKMVKVYKEELKRRVKNTQQKGE